MTFVVMLIALLSGIANPFQSAANAQLNKQLASPVWAGLCVYATGLGGMLLILLFRRTMPGAPWQGVSWWSWLGGLISIAATMAGLTLTHRLGSGAFTGLTVTASLVTSLLFDHFGLLGLDRHPASPLRIFGCALMIVGVWLFARF